MRLVYIYVLRDPKNSQVRYVGKTVQKVNDRLTTHIRQAKRENKSHKDRWILQVISDGNRPIVEIVEEANDDNWIERERYWIVHYYNEGCKLTNETDGGEGLHGHKFSKEHRKKIGNAQIGNKRGLGYKHTDEHKAKIKKRMTGEGNPNYGKEFSVKHRESLSKAKKGKKLSNETKRKISQSAKGNQYGKGYKQTDEHKRKIAESKVKSRNKKALVSRVYYLSSNKPRDLEIVMTISIWDDGQFGLYLKDLNLFLDENGLEMDYIKKWWRTGNEPGKKMQDMARKCREDIDEVRSMSVEELAKAIGF